MMVVTGVVALSMPPVAESTSCRPRARGEVQGDVTEDRRDAEVPPRTTGRRKPVTEDARLTATSTAAPRMSRITTVCTGVIPRSASLVHRKPDPHSSLVHPPVEARTALSALDSPAFPPSARKRVYAGRLRRLRLAVGSRRVRARSPLSLRSPSGTLVNERGGCPYQRYA